LVFDFGGSVFDGFVPKVKSILEEIDEFLLRVSGIAGWLYLLSGICAKVDELHYERMIFNALFTQSLCMSAYSRTPVVPQSRS